ncbi:MAG: GerMN domain-containing protein [Treponema sp.]|nr:GerMN domain-containing protein [Treponema sp.]
MKESTKKQLVFLPLLIMGLALALSAVLYAVRNPWHRYVMFFGEYGSDKIYSETRLVSKEDTFQDQVQAFTDSLVLGPRTNRFLPLFASGTTVEFCIVKDGTAYVGLSENALFFSEECADIKTGISMLKRNIVRNFTNIDTVEVYIDSIQVEG